MFDTVDYIILIKNLETNGIKGINLAWLRDYLTNRKHYISINHHRVKSVRIQSECWKIQTRKNPNTDTFHAVHELEIDTQNIHCGVPQGSILGSPLFLLCANDMGSHRRCSVKKGALNFFSNFIGKHLCWSLFLIKLQA